MFKVTATVTRPDTSSEFWIMTENLPTDWFKFGDQFITEGKLLNSSRNISADNLSLTAVFYFRDETSSNGFFAAYANQYPEIAKSRVEYETLHGHTRTVIKTTL